jgi:transposase-like protein
VVFGGQKMALERPRVRTRRGEEVELTSYRCLQQDGRMLRAAVERVFGERAEVQRCPLHKRRNVKEHLAEHCRAPYDRPIRAAYAMSGYAEAKTALERSWRELCDVNPSAARSLEEGMEETLTLHRLGVAPLLRRSLATTNLIESCLSTVRHVARNVKRWQGGDHVARWTAAGLLEAEKKFRRVKGFRELKELARRLNPELHSQVQVA